MNAWPGVIERYRQFLPVSPGTPVVTLHEGNTPLVPAPRLAEATDGSIVARFGIPINLCDNMFVIAEKV